MRLVLLILPLFTLTLVGCVGLTTGKLQFESPTSGEITFTGGFGSPAPITGPLTLRSIIQMGDVSRAPGGDTSNEDFCTKGHVDASGNLYCAGGTYGSFAEAAGGGLDMVVTKFNSAGQLLWARQLGNVTKAPGGSNAGSDGVNDMTVDSSGNVYLAGYTTGGMAEAHGGANEDSVIVKLNADGTLAWVRQYGNDTNPDPTTRDQFTAIAIAPNGNIICAGFTTGGINEPNGGGGLNDIFYSRFHHSGVLLAHMQFGSVTTIPNSGVSDLAETVTDIAFDSAGDLIIAAHTDSDFGDDAFGTDILIVKANYLLGTITWATQYGVNNIPVFGFTNYGDQKSKGLAIDPATDDIFVLGVSDTTVVEANAGSNDIILYKLSSAGTPTWVRQFGATTLPMMYGLNNDNPGGISLHTDGSIYVSGLTFSSLGEARSTSSDMFVAKFSAAGSLTKIMQAGAVTALPGQDNTGEESCDDVHYFNNSVYCFGSATTFFGEANGGFHDMFIARLSE